jgi:hypothetical protein
MANYATLANLKAKRFLAPFSRYLNSNVLYYTEHNLLTFETYKRTPIPVSEQDQYTVISSGMEYRPDLMSNRAYGFPDLWWKIMQANDMKDIWEFKAGVNIRIPRSIF